MARQVRIQFAGAIYHVMCRGNRQEAVFKDDRDCETFLNTLEEASIRCGWLLHAFVLMGNHYHLLLETPEPNLVDGMRWLQGTYTQRFNARHNVRGHLFQGRYKALLVDGEGDYFQTVASYIHLNPARARCFDLKKGRLTDYRWSSYLGYLRPSKRPGFLCVERELGNYGWIDDSRGRGDYRERMKKRVVEIANSANPKEADEQWRKIRRGWAFGSEAFVDEMKERIEGAVRGRRRDSFMGEQITHHDEQEAERLFKQGLKAVGLSEPELIGLKKSDDRKKVVAWLIRKNTSVHNEWITNRLFMGRTSNLSYHVRQAEESKKGTLRKLKQKIMI